jgi:hypothetical protein
MPHPPSDRADVVRAADGFVLILPPRLSSDFALWAGFALALALLLMVSSVAPLGEVWPFNAAHTVARLIKAAVGIAILYAIIDEFIAGQRGWTVITVRNDRLTVTSPGFLRSSRRDYWLEDARTDCSDSIGGLTLVRTDGKEQVILQKTVYRPQRPSVCDWSSPFRPC